MAQRNTQHEISCHLQGPSSNRARCSNPRLANSAVLSQRQKQNGGELWQCLLPAARPCQQMTASPYPFRKPLCSPLYSWPGCCSNSAGRTRFWGRLSASTLFLCLGWYVTLLVQQACHRIWVYGPPCSSTKGPARGHCIQVRPTLFGQDVMPQAVLPITVSACTMAWHLADHKPSDAAALGLTSMLCRGRTISAGQSWPVFCRH